MAKPILDTIDSPRDLKKLSHAELTTLATEIRETIIAVCSKNGGHLAPSLGAVELILALHRVFDAPNDSLVFDVGHQAYAHKLITGRRKLFETLRQHDGISGFLKCDESEYDAFGAGHAGTSISAALGIAVAKSLKNDHSKTIAVIGDGGLTCGIAYEGLNNTGGVLSHHRNLIVVLNDNNMSISKNVGSVSSFLSRKSTSPAMYRFQSDVKELLNKVPGVGRELVSVAKKSKDILRSMLTPGAMFQWLGFRYVGPIDGHNLNELIEAFSNVKKIEEPVLVHVVTVKGKGYALAEEDPEKFHGLGPFHASTGGLVVSSDGPKKTYSDVFGETLCELAKDDSSIVAITAAMTGGTGLSEFSEKFKDRFFDVGIAESHAVIFAAGLASKGLKPVVSIYSSFLQRAYDSIIHDVCLQNLPVIFAIDRAGLVGSDGATHHGVFDLSYLGMIPGLIVMAPKDGRELQSMLYTATRLNRPVAIRYPRGNASQAVSVGLCREMMPLKCEIIETATDGLANQKKVLVLSIGTMYDCALHAVQLLKKEGVNVHFINARFLKPIDDEVIIHYAKDSCLVVTIEENAILGGFGSCIRSLINENKSLVPVLTFGIPDCFVGHGDTDKLLKQCNLDSFQIVESVLRRLVNNN